jgi:hypothetical protein
LGAKFFAIAHGIEEVISQNLINFRPYLRLRKHTSTASFSGKSPTSAFNADSAELKAD